MFNYRLLPFLICTCLFRCTDLVDHPSGVYPAACGGESGFYHSQFSIYEVDQDSIQAYALSNFADAGEYSRRSISTSIFTDPDIRMNVVGEVDTTTGAIRAEELTIMTSERPTQKTLNEFEVLIRSHLPSP